MRWHYLLQRPIPNRSLTDWVAEDIGTPEPNGATFTLKVDDLDYVAGSNVTGVGNWAVTFVPRGTTTAQSLRGYDAENGVRFGWASERAALLGSVSSLRIGVRPTRSDT